MARRQRRRSCAPSSRNPSPNGSSPTLSSSSTPSPAPPSANSRKSLSANNSPTGSGSNNRASIDFFPSFVGAQLYPEHMRGNAAPHLGTIAPPHPGARQLYFFGGSHL